MSEKDKGPAIVTSIENARQSDFHPGDVVCYRSGSNSMVVDSANATKVVCKFLDHTGKEETRNVAPHLIETIENHTRRQLDIHNISCPHNPANSGVDLSREDDSSVMMLMTPNGPVQAPPELRRLIEEIMDKD